MTDSEIFQKCLDREKEGLKSYGEFDPEADNRDLFMEMEDELIDLMNYARFQIKKIRALRGQNE